MLNLQKDVADARTKQAEAEQKLEFLRKRQSPRWLSDEFRERLRNKPTGQVVIVYVGGSSEVIMFAEALSETLRDVGWEVSPPTQISSVLDVMPSGRSSGEVIVLCKLPKGARAVPSHVQALYDALSKERFRASMNAGIGHTLPDERARIIINPRQ